MKFHLSPNQWQVLLFIIRKTYGYQKKVDHIANSQICLGTGLCKAVVCRVIKDLGEMNIIIRDGKNTGFQKDWEMWKKLAIPSTKVSSLANSEKLAESSTLGSKLAEQSTNEKLAIPSMELAIQSTGVDQTANKKLTKLLPTKERKETITKETIQKKEYVLPDWLNRESWNAFIEMRRRIKKPLTDYGCQVAIKKLQKLKDAGQDPNAILDNSIMNSWQGIWPEKGDGDNGRTGTNLRRLPKVYTRPDEL